MPKFLRNVTSVLNLCVSGGVRGVGLIWCGLFSRSESVSNQTFHIVDWLPTLVKAAGGNANDIEEKTDGLNMWDALTEDKVSPRNVTLHNIDDVKGVAAITVDDWKLIQGM